MQSKLKTQKEISVVANTGSNAPKPQNVSHKKAVTVRGILFVALIKAPANKTIKYTSLPMGRENRWFAIKKQRVPVNAPRVSKGTKSPPVMPIAFETTRKRVRKTNSNITMDKTRF